MYFKKMSKKTKTCKAVWLTKEFVYNIPFFYLLSSPFDCDNYLGILNYIQLLILILAHFLCIFLFGQFVQ